MAKYRSASLHVLGSEKASPSDIPSLPGLTNVAPAGGADPDVCAEVAAEQDLEDRVVGPTQHALARPRARVVAPAWLAGGAAALALLGLVAWGTHDAFGARKSQAFPCPPATTAAVQAATGCAVPLPPAIDGENEE